MDSNYFAVLMKAFVEKFNGQTPTQEQWVTLVQLLNQVPTERLTK